MGYSPWGHKESDTTERLSVCIPCTRTKLSPESNSVLSLRGRGQGWKVALT